MFSVSYKDPRPIYEQVKQGLKDMMASGEIEKGGKLPSVRDLAVQLTINPNTIQRAYRELEAEGVICSVPGKGSFVSEDHDPIQARKQALFKALDSAFSQLMEAGVSKGEVLSHLIERGEEQ